MLQVAKRELQVKEQQAHELLALLSDTAALGAGDDSDDPTSQAAAAGAPPVAALLARALAAEEEKLQLTRALAESTELRRQLDVQLQELRREDGQGTLAVQQLQQETHAIYDHVCAGAGLSRACCHVSHSVSLPLCLCLTDLYLPACLTGWPVTGLTAWLVTAHQHLHVPARLADLYLPT